MTTNKHLLALIARRTPAIWDVIGPAELNPQPLPPIARAALEAGSELNPQPLPPGPPPETVGALVGRELISLAWTADKLGVTLSSTADWEDDPCPVYPKGPSIPFPVGPFPEPGPHPEWQRAYTLGLASVLATAELAGFRTEFSADTLARAVRALDGPA